MKRSKAVYMDVNFIHNRISSLFLICIGMSLIFLSCKNEKSDIRKVDIPVNNIHVNLLSWHSALSLEEGLYLYNGEVYSGHLNNNALNYKIKASVVLVDGLLHGPFKEVYANGQKRTLRQYHKGYEKGPQQGWHSNGELSYRYEADSGLRQGLYQEYYPSGNLQVESVYTDGLEIKRKVKDIGGDIIVNYEIKDGRYYGLLGSSSCITVFEDVQYRGSYEN